MTVGRNTIFVLLTFYIILWCFYYTNFFCNVSEFFRCQRKDNLSMRHTCIIASWVTHFPLYDSILLACSILPHKPVFNANHWHNSSGDIFVGRISTSSINSRGHRFLLSNTKWLGLKALKGIKKLIMLQQVSTETLWSCFPITRMQKLVLKGKKNIFLKVSLSYINFYWAQDVSGWADCNSVQKECPSHTHLLECFLQLWTLHCFSWTYDFRLAMSNKLNT